jgi:Flp pilus assembly pilin Flp
VERESLRQDGDGVRRLLERLIREDTGQDLVEYALLVAFFGVAFLAVWTGIADAVQASYGSTSATVSGLSEPPDPGGSPP